MVQLQAAKRSSAFPFDAAVVQALTRLEFKSPVTFLVGENGTGKSLLLEPLDSHGLSRSHHSEPGGAAHSRGRV
jgi:predicted ATPase